VEVVNSDSDSDVARVASPLGRVGSVFGPQDAAAPHDAAALDRLAIARTGVARYAARQLSAQQ